MKKAIKLSRAVYEEPELQVIEVSFEGNLCLSQNQVSGNRNSYGVANEQNWE